MGQSMNCTRFRETIFLYTDNEMEEELLVAFREHLVLCPECARQIDYTRRVRALLKQGCSKSRAPERLRKRIIISLRRGRAGYQS